MNFKDLSLFVWLFIVVASAAKLGYIYGKEYEESRTKTSMYDMKLPNGFIIACSYMNEGNEKNAKVMVEVYDALHNCEEKK